jgi:formate/nitrite transporter FocA (FNT family)
MVFPVGLIMVVLTGADLYTSYCMYSVVALLHRRCSVFDLLKTWFVSFFGNLAGALFFMAVLTGCKSSCYLQTMNTTLTLKRRWDIRDRRLQG